MNSEAAFITATARRPAAAGGEGGDHVADRAITLYPRLRARGERRTGRVTRAIVARSTYLFDRIAAYFDESKS